jgi:hypothetical protein
VQTFGPRLRAHVIWAAAFVGLAMLPAEGASQEALGPHDDVTLPARRTVRLIAFTAFEHYSRVFGNITGAPLSAHAPLLGQLQSDAAGTAAIPFLAPAEAAIRTASNLSAFSLSIGAVTARAEVTDAVMPVGMEVGLGNRFSIGAVLPIIRRRRDVSVLLNPTGSPGSSNVGRNPARSGGTQGIARATNTLLRQQLTSAASALESALVTCLQTPTAGNCGSVNANRATATALVADTRTLRGQLEALYGSDTVTAFSAVAPLAGSEPQGAIDARLGAMNGSYRAFLGLAAGAPDPIGARPFAAQTPLTTADAESMLSGDVFGVHADSSLRPRSLFGIGDLEFVARVLLAGRPGPPADSAATARPTVIRSVLAAVYRVGTSTTEWPDDVLETPRLSGQSDVEVRSTTSLSIGSRLSATLYGSYTVQLAHEPTVRIRELGELFPPAYASQPVSRDPGDYFIAEVNPRFRFNSLISVVGHYSVRHKGADAYTGTYTIPGTVTGNGEVVLDASALQTGTAETEQRAGGGIIITPRRPKGQAASGLPSEIAFFHHQTVSGSGRGLPRESQDQLRIRLFVSLFGR